MFLKKGSKQCLLATVATIERMLKEIKGEVTQGEDGVKPYPTTPVMKEEKPAAIINEKSVEIKTPAENDLKLPGGAPKDPVTPGGYAKETPKIYDEKTKLATQAAEAEPGIAKIEKPALKIYKETNQWASGRNILKAAMATEAEYFGNSFELEANQAEAELFTKAEVTQTEKGVNIKTQEPSQNANGVPEISRQVKTEKPAVEVHDCSDAVVNEKAIMTPKSTGEAEKNPAGSNGSKVEKNPDVYDENKEMVNSKDLLKASRRINKKRIA